MEVRDTLTSTPYRKRREGGGAGGGMEEGLLVGAIIHYP